MRTTIREASLYPTLGTTENRNSVRDLMNIIAIQMAKTFTEYKK